MFSSPMFKELRPAALAFLVLTFLTGIIYPLIVTAFAQLFPDKAAGSVIEVNGRAVGSELIGQAFSDPKYFWSRPSATSPMPYSGGSSGGSNQGPLKPALADAGKTRVQALRDADPGNTRPVPVDLVTASASGPDPPISGAGAAHQAAPVARGRRRALAPVQAR